ncbi:unnamed protein product, partial [Medioppia subpectinata]
RPQFSCKICSQEYTPDECIDNTFQAIHWSRNNGESNESGVCNQCHKNKPLVIRCKECEWICEPCHQLHTNISIFESHELDESSRVSPNADLCLNNTCPTHNEEITVYCKTCRNAFCARCILRDHNLHVYEDAKDMTQMGKFFDSFRTRVAQITDKRTICENTLEKFETIETDISSQRDVCVNRIKDIIGRLHTKVDDMGTTLLDGVNNKCNEKQTEYSSKKCQLKQMNQSFEFIEQFMSAILDLNEPMSVLKAQDLLSSQLQKLLTKPCSNPDYITPFTIEVKDQLTDGSGDGLNINKMIDGVFNMCFSIVSSDDKQTKTANSNTKNSNNNTNESNDLDDDIAEIFELPNSRPSAGQTSTALHAANIGNTQTIAQTTAQTAAQHSYHYNNYNNNNQNKHLRNMLDSNPQNSRQTHALQTNIANASMHLQNINSMTNSITQNNTPVQAMASYGSPGVYRGPVASADSCQQIHRNGNPPNYMSIATMANPPNVTVNTNNTFTGANSTAQPQPATTYGHNLRMYAGGNIMQGPNPITRTLLQNRPHEGKTTVIYPNNIQAPTRSQLATRLQQQPHQYFQYIQPQHTVPTRPQPLQPQTQLHSQLQSQLQAQSQPQTRPQLQSQSRPSLQPQTQHAVQYLQQLQQQTHQPTQQSHPNQRQMQQQFDLQLQHQKEIQREKEINEIAKELEKASEGFPTDPISSHISSIIREQQDIIASQSQAYRTHTQNTRPVNTIAPQTACQTQNDPIVELHIPDNWCPLPTASQNTTQTPIEPQIVSNVTIAATTPRNSIDDMIAAVPTRPTSTDSGIQTPVLSMPTVSDIIDNSLPNSAEVDTTGDTTDRRPSGDNSETILPNSPNPPSVDSLFSSTEFISSDINAEEKDKEENNTIESEVSTTVTVTPLPKPTAPVARIAPITTTEEADSPPNDLMSDDDSEERESIDEDAFCVVCDREFGEFIICGNCSRSFHKECHVPEIKTMPETTFVCTFCKELPSAQSAARVRRPGLNDRQLMTCEKVMIALICHKLSQQLKPIENETQSEQNTTLLTIKDNLENRRYENEVDFIADIRRMIANYKNRSDITPEDMNNFNAFEKYFQTKLRKLMPAFANTTHTNSSADNTGGNHKKSKTSYKIW